MTASPACLSRQVGVFCPRRGGVPGWSPARPCRRCTRRGLALFVACCPLPLACFPAPYPPAPLPRRGRGRPKVYFAGGFAPGTPALNRLRHLQTLPSRHRRGTCFRRRQLGAKPIEPPFYWQCRQPRRGGTGGEELRRLRWSSPPGQGEPVPSGFSPPPAPDLPRQM